MLNAWAPVRDAKDCGHQDQWAACASPAIPAGDSAVPGSSGRYVLTEPWGKGRQPSPDCGHRTCPSVQSGSALCCAAFSSFRSPRFCTEPPLFLSPLGGMGLLRVLLRLSSRGPRPSPHSGQPLAWPPPHLRAEPLGGGAARLSLGRRGCDSACPDASLCPSWRLTARS